MPLKFGTSGLRGLVENMTDLECYRYARAFLRYARSSDGFTAAALGGDFRASTPRIMRAVGFAMQEEGCKKIHFQGVLPTPAVTLFGIRNSIPSIMVTGSHIPDDRNGIKFNLPHGEILKGDETGIMEQYRKLKADGTGMEGFTSDGNLREDFNYNLPAAENSAMEMYRDRLVDFFGNGKPLDGAKVVFYQHSSTSREIIPEILEKLGAEVINKGFSDTFVPVDTEAVKDLDKLAGWVREGQADALFSTDGDGDRPLVVDDQGNFIRGDILGILVSDFLGADSIVTPVSCSTSVDRCGKFTTILRTRIGSPFVVEGMQELAGQGKVVTGYEANGGFMTGSPVPARPGGSALDPLPTRDAALPAISSLLSARQEGISLSSLVDKLPARYSDAQLTRGVPAETGKHLMGTILAGGSQLLESVFGPESGTVESADNTDGYRILFSSGDIVHFRPSGNAPEFRCYTEADSREKAAALAVRGIDWIRGLTIDD